MKKYCAYLVLSLIPHFASAEIDESIKKEGEAALKQFNTGNALDVTGIAKTMSDLIPQFQINLGDGDISENGEINKIGFTYSPKWENHFDMGITVNFEKPTINPAFEEQSLLTSDQANALSDFELGDTVEYELTFSYLGELLGKKYGRSLTDYQQEMNILIDLAENATSYKGSTAKSQFSMDIRAKRLTVYGELSSDCGQIAQDLQTAVNGGETTKKGLESVIEPYIKNPLRVGPDTATQQRCRNLANSFIGHTVAIEDALEVYVRKLNNSLRLIGVHQLTSMVAQQPQLLVSISHTDRDELSGSDEFSAAITFEHNIGGGSLNDFWESIPNHCRSGKDDVAVDCLTRIQEYLVKDVTQENQFRFAATAEYKRIDDYSIQLNDPVLSFSTEEVKTWTVQASLYWQRYLSETDPTPIVFEGSISHSNPDGDMMNDQNMASLSATKVIGGISWTAALVWSDEPEFKFDQSDDSVRVTLGFKYKL